MELGLTTTSAIINKTKINAARVYENLQKLIDKGLVSYIIQRNRKYFKAENPDSLINYLEDQKKLIDKKEEKIKELIPKLIVNQEKIEQKAAIYEGMKGIKLIFEQILKETRKGDEILTLGAPKSANIKFDAYLLEYHKRRSKKRIKERLLHNENNREYASARAKLQNTKVKYMPKNLVTPAWIKIWKNTTSIMMVEDMPIAFTINNKNIADSFRNYFEIMWKVSNY